jgi:hypothetical protein
MIKILAVGLLLLEDDSLYYHLYIESHIFTTITCSCGIAFFTFFSSRAQIIIKENSFFEEFKGKSRDSQKKISNLYENPNIRRSSNLVSPESPVNFIMTKNREKYQNAIRHLAPLTF